VNYENLLNWIESTSIYRRAKYKKVDSRLNAINGLVPDDSKVLLNFGCGNMYLDKLLARDFPDLKIIGLDIIEHHDMDISEFPNLTFHLYD
jgi:trans-aconitate methyltransferase